jgi:hypothetical protein
VSYCYRVYGLTIDSTTSIVGLDIYPRETPLPDLCVGTGPEPTWVTRARALPRRVISRRSECEDNADPVFQLIEHGPAECFELVYSDGASFVVDAQACRVWGTLRPPLTDADLATYFLGPVLGFILRRRLITSLHASAVELFGHAVAVSGDAGFGKSTTAAALALRGVPVLSEDIAALHEGGWPLLRHPWLPAGVLVARFCDLSHGIC